MDGDDTLPDYAPSLSAFHAAFEGELRAMLAGLPIARGSRVLDVACGDGAYTRWLADLVGPGGLVVGLDASVAYLREARQEAGGRFVAATLERTPFAPGTFDAAWCAQSLYSLHDPVAAIRQVAGAVRPGGVVAVLEDDTLHQLLLPWPVEVELAVRRAELIDFVTDSDRPRKYYVGRRLVQVLRAAGLEGCRRRTWATDRQAPLDPATHAYLEAYLADLRERTAPHLEPSWRRRAEPYLDPGADEYLLAWPDLAVTIIDHVVWGVKPTA